MQTSDQTKKLLSSLDLSECPNKLQSKLHSVVKDKRFEQFLQTCQDKEERARIISCSGLDGQCVAGCNS